MYFLHIYTHMFTCVYTHIRIYAYISTDTHTHTYMHRHISFVCLTEKLVFIFRGKRKTPSRWERKVTADRSSGWPFPCASHSHGLLEHMVYWFVMSWTDGQEKYPRYPCLLDHIEEYLLESIWETHLETPIHKYTEKMLYTQHTIQTSVFWALPVKA